MFLELKSSMLQDWTSYNSPQEVNWVDLSFGLKVHLPTSTNCSEHTDIHQFWRMDINCWDHSSPTQIWLESSTLTKSKRKFNQLNQSQFSMMFKRKIHWKTPKLWTDWIHMPENKEQLQLLPSKPTQREQRRSRRYIFFFNSFLEQGT